MKLLLDTHLLLWAAGEPRRLSAAARKHISDPDNELIFSAASIWEVSIKNSLGKASFRADPGALRRGLLENGYVELPITGQHAVNVDSLPPIHRDPFDRLLISQALAEGITLLTVDPDVARYKGPVRKV